MGGYEIQGNTRSQHLCVDGKKTVAAPASRGEEGKKSNTNYICREIKNDFKFYFLVSQHIPWRYFI